MTKPLTGGTYFSGGEGVGVAMRAAGIEHKFGVEFNAQIAEIARANGFDVMTADVCAVDPAALPYVDIFHASPVCKNASTAKADGEESPEDIATAEAVCRYVEHHRPRVFTLENVWGYRKFDAFAAVLKTLTRCGYKWDYWHLNAADYGVPQTRKRLILIAALEFQPTKPRETHTEKPLPMFETLAPWVGWYEAIEDLIPTLPPSKFADWQLGRLPDEITESLFVQGANTKSNGKVFNNGSARSRTIDTGSIPKAFVVDGKLGSYSTNLTTRDGGEPFATVTTSHNNRDLRAFIMPNENSGSAVVRERDEPSPTIGATQRVGNVSRAWLSSGRVVKMTPRALARFQSFPDSYVLPEKTSLACTIIGNAVPPKLYAAVLRAIT